MNLLSISLPHYSEIPGVGLYLKQVVVFINESAAPLLTAPVTETMLSNYVKMHLVPGPVKKQYSRSLIAELMILILSKSAVSLDNMPIFLEVLQAETETETAYNSFCDALSAALSGDVVDAQPLLKQVTAVIAAKFSLDAEFAKEQALRSEEVEETE